MVAVTTALRGAASSLLLAIALVTGGCGDQPGEAPADARVTVYVSLPLAGPFGADGRDAADGARLALAEAGGEAAGIAVEARFLDDTDRRVRGAAALPSPVRAAANARVATEDSTAIAYLGELTSGATRASLPITNEARLLQVSPGAGAGDLVAEFAGSDEVPPAQPSGERSFGRVVPSDADQAAAAASWAADLGWSEVGIERERGELGSTLAGEFRDEARELGLELVPAAEAGRIYLAGSTQLAGGLGAAPGADGSKGPTLMASDAFLSAASAEAEDPGGPRGWASVEPRSAGDILATSAALDPDQLPPAGRELAARFEQRYGRVPGRYAAYGYEAMAVALDALERASDALDRQAVIAAFLATENRDSVLGDYSIDDAGEPTLDRLTGYRLRGRPGAGRPPAAVAELRVP